MPQELNLLPPQRREHLIREGVVTSVKSGMQSLAIGLGIVTLSAVVMAIMLQFMVAATSDTATAALTQKIKTYQDTRSAIAAHNNLIKTMASLSDARIVWSDLFNSIFSALPPGVVLSGMSADTITSSYISIVGQAPSRAALVVLNDRLKVIPWVASVNAPDSNLLERDNPQFKFTILINKEKLP